MEDDDYEWCMRWSSFTRKIPIRISTARNKYLFLTDQPTLKPRSDPYIMWTDKKPHRDEVANYTVRFISLGTNLRQCNQLIYNFYNSLRPWFIQPLGWRCSQAKKPIVRMYKMCCIPIKIYNAPSFICPLEHTAFEVWSTASAKGIYLVGQYGRTIADGAIADNICV